MADSVVLGQARVFRDTEAILAETPFWSDGCLYWADIDRGELHVSSPDGAVDGSDDTVLRFPSALPAIQPAPDGFVIALADRVILADRQGREQRELARMTFPRPGMRLNEGKVDPQGRFLVGGMDKQEADAVWYRVGPDRTETLLGGFGITNGLEFSLDERTVYLADTAVQTIYRAPWDPEAGPGELTVFHSGASSDGAALDEDGCLWSAINASGCVLRLDPTGREIDRVTVPAPGVTGVCFGGEDRSTLFICSATENMTEQQLGAAPLSGAVFAVETATRGRPVRTFAA